MTILFWADLHLFDQEVAQHRGYTGITDHMHQAIIEPWKNTVSDNNTVYILGDLDNGTPKSRELALALINQLPGTKHLVSGNKDAVHMMHAPTDTAQAQYLEVFKTVKTHTFLNLVHPQNAQRTVRARLNHFPYHFDGPHLADAQRAVPHDLRTGKPMRGYDDLQHQHYRPMRPEPKRTRFNDPALVLLHGHTHSTQTVSDPAAPSFNLGVDAHPRPVPASQVWDWIENTH